MVRQFAFLLIAAWAGASFSAAAVPGFAPLAQEQPPSSSEENPSQDEPAEEAPQQPESEAPAPPQGEEEQITEPAVQDPAAALESAKNQREALGMELAAGSAEEQMAKSLDLRIQLLNELIQVQQRHKHFRRDLEASTEGTATLQARKEALEQRPEAEAPSDPDPEQLKALDKQAGELRSQIEKIQTAISTQDKVASDMADLQSQWQERETKAQARLTELQDQPPAEGQSPEQQALYLDNAKLEIQLAGEARTWLEEVSETGPGLESYRALQLEVAQLQLEQANAELELYRQALEDQLEQAQKAKQEEAARLEALAEKADTPQQRFLAEWQAKIARVEANLAAMGPFGVRLSKETADLEGRLTENKTTLSRLQDYVTKYGTSGQVGEMIRATYQRLPQKRKALELAVSPEVESTLNGYRGRRFEVDDTLFSLNDLWKAEFEQATADLEEGEKESIRREGGKLRDEYRNLLTTEKASLGGILPQGQQLLNLRFELTTTLNEMGAFIHSKVFWIRDRVPLNLETFGELVDEGEVLIDWGSDQLPGTETEPRTWSDFIHPRQIGLLAVLLLLLPFLFLLVRKGLLRYAGEFQSQSPGPWKANLRPLVLTSLAALLLPGYVFVAAFGVTLLDFPGQYPILLVGLIQHLAWLVLFWNLNRLLFTKSGLCRQMEWMPEEPCRTLYRTLRLVLWGYLFLWIPHELLLAEPFELVYLPRILWTAFLVVGAMALYRLLRPNSPVLRVALEERIASYLQKGKGVWNLLILVLVLSLPVLDFAGYGFAALHLAKGLILTAVVVMVLPPIYRSVVHALDRIQARIWRRSRQQENGTEETDQRELEQLRVFIRALFVVVGILVIASIWGLNQNFWQAMEGRELYQAGTTAAGDPISVTAADMIRAGLTFLVTIWLLRNLRGLLDLLFFSRINMDQGLRYAISTMASYALFFLGALAALSTIHLDMSSIGWLVAAMGLGLGFGLQEIVSNFVSGIILLVERPIRVGDQVTVGTVTGKIQKINIRATTVLNFDRQEVIVPNRTLISKEVVNWTLADSLTRLVIPIGVDYGSDISQVRELLLDLATSQPEALKDPAPQVFFVNHGASSLDFEIRLFLSSPSQRMVVTDRINQQINHGLEKIGVGIPFPQQDLHIKEWPEISSGSDSKGHQMKPNPGNKENAGEAVEEMESKTT